MNSQSDTKKSDMGDAKDERRVYKVDFIYCEWETSSKIFSGFPFAATQSSNGHGNL